MRSEYDPIGGDTSPAGEADLALVQEKFAAASRPYLSSPLGWLAWACLLPAAALLTPTALRRAGPAGILFLWSGAILVGGLVEMVPLLAGGGRRRVGRAARTPLATWALRAQGNLSAVGAALSAIFVWQDQAALLPALWLLLLGHSFYVLGGLAFRPMRTCGLFYQAAGLLALWPRAAPLTVFAAATALGNLGLAWSVRRARRVGESAPRSGGATLGT